MPVSLTANAAWMAVIEQPSLGLMVVSQLL